MIKAESRKLSPEDCKTLAEITLSARKGTPLESGRSFEETEAFIEGLSANKAFQILVAQDEKDTIIGWTYDYVAFPLMTFISGFFPLMNPAHEPEKIALALIEASKSKIIEHGHSRLEIELEFPTKAHRELSEKLVAWYRKCGFKFAAEEVHMKTDLKTIELPDLSQPKEYTLKRFSEFSYEELEAPGYQIYENSLDDLFLSMSHAEQRVTLQHFFDKSNPFAEEASLILEKEDRVAGFIITRRRNEEITIGPIGVVHEARGQGLGKYLLVYALRKIRDDGSNIVGLDMSVNNHPARRLYQRYGFKVVSHKQFYYWSPS